jgi:hypothetical protein
MVLADVSTVGRDAVTGIPYRNGNVMYEVGIALACRHTQDVLLIRDDHDKFLFDVSTIPHMRLDFTDTEQARVRLSEELTNRLREQKLMEDARVKLAIAGLSAEELSALRNMAEYSPSTVWGRPDKGVVDFFAMASTPRLLDKQLIQLVGQFEEGYPAYRATVFGRIVATLVKDRLQKFKAEVPTNKSDTESSPGDG